jgi:hypothetical protein
MSALPKDMRSATVKKMYGVAYLGTPSLIVRG